MTQPNDNIPDNMKAIAIDRFGGIDEFKLQTLPVPEIDPDELLIRVDTAGIAEWDPFEREGKYAELMPGEPRSPYVLDSDDAGPMRFHHVFTGERIRFPYVLGSDGAGTIVAVGEQVNRFNKGDRVYAASLANPKGGFYAEYIAVKADKASHVPANLPIKQAGVMTVDAITALTGLDNVLGLTQNESLMIFGASGGIGHMAVQFAKRMGARVFAIASGDDGVELVKKLGADAVVDGRREDVAKVAKDFAPDGLDAALATAGGEVADQALTSVREGGRVIYPNGVTPKPNVNTGVNLQNYDMMSVGGESIDKINRMIEGGPFEVHIGNTYAFSLEEIKEAHQALDKHYLGKLALKFNNDKDQMRPNKSL